MRILIADQNRTFRAEFVALITHCHPAWQITEVDDAADMHARMLSSRFDVAFVGLDLDATADLQALREDCPTTKIIGLGEHDDTATIVRCIQDGLGGYIARNSTGTRLFTTLKVIATPDLFVSTGNAMVPRNSPQPPQPQLSLVQPPPPPRPLRPAAAAATPETAGHPLTARQVDVLKLLAEGRSTKDIARRLGLAVPTVKTHLAAVYRQLGARNRLQAVVKASAIAANAATSAATHAMMRPLAPSPMYERHFAAG